MRLLEEIAIDRPVSLFSTGTIQARHSNGAEPDDDKDNSVDSELGELSLSSDA